MYISILKMNTKRHKEIKKHIYTHIEFVDRSLDVQHTNRRQTDEKTELDVDIDL